MMELLKQIIGAIFLLLVIIFVLCFSIQGMRVELNNDQIQIEASQADRYKESAPTDTIMPYEEKGELND